MGGYGDVQMIDENGLRVDGRGPGDIREITIETGVVPVADGSCRMTWGTNEAIVAVYGPMEAHPRKIQRQDRAVLDVAYNMAPFSTTDRMRPGFNRRSREISKVTKDALEPFRCSTPEREYDLLPYLKDTRPMLYDIELSTHIQTQKSNELVLSTTNFNEMYYSSAEQIAHHTSSGCPMNVCDLIGSGTISGENKSQLGSMLELSWGGKEPIKLENDETRTFLEDGDTLTLRGQCNGPNYCIGFGKCSGKVVPAKNKLSEE